MALPWPILIVTASRLPSQRSYDHRLPKRRLGARVPVPLVGHAAHRPTDRTDDARTPRSVKTTTSGSGRFSRGSAPRRAPGETATAERSLSVAHADPAANCPWALTALDARFTALLLQRGSREIVAGDVFHAPLMTALEPDERLVEIEVPHPARCGAGSPITPGRTRLASRARRSCRGDRARGGSRCSAQGRPCAGARRTPSARLRGSPLEGLPDRGRGLDDDYRRARSRLDSRAPRDRGVPPRRVSIEVGSRCAPTRRCRAVRTLLRLHPPHRRAHRTHRLRSPVVAARGTGQMTA